MRLDRWLVTLGIGSRRDVQKLIRSGRVSVTGKPVTDPGADTDPAAGGLALDGVPVDGRLERHVMLYKPAGLLTAARDRKQPTVMDLLPDTLAAVGCMPCGRLDKDTTGLLFLTTDGELNHRLLSPARHVDKKYIAVVDGPLGESEKAAFAAGIVRGEFEARPAILTVLRSSRTESEAELVIHEGQFHQVKRMFEAVGRTVTRLHRDSFGPLTLDPALAAGSWRELTPEEVTALRKSAGMDA